MVFFLVFLLIRKIILIVFFFLKFRLIVSIFRDGIVIEDSVVEDSYLCWGGGFVFFIFCYLFSIVFYIVVTI